MITGQKLGQRIAYLHYVFLEAKIVQTDKELNELLDGLNYLGGFFEVSKIYPLTIYYRTEAERVEKMLRARKTS